ncbi:MAG: LysM peptidoglycan-binding domain-containing protein [Eubacteriales bacterium]|nr:LysM peptidoglycan-binding domain-containing protein [Eubacteriales bacterium]MDD4583375.1 LysM peptidoglycan-binding domain-containing protein [Eubacteriales bacterium]
MRKYRIKSHLRFSAFVTILFIAVVFIVGITTGMDQVASLSKPTYETILIQTGDTLWDLAKTYGPDNQDIRKTVHSICVINNIAPQDIQPGQSIRIPYI